MSAFFTFILPLTLYDRKEPGFHSRLIFIMILKSRNGIISRKDTLYTGREVQVASKNFLNTESKSKSMAIVHAI